MKEQKIEFVEYERLSDRSFHHDVFCFRKDRPLHWLQKVCLYILKKIKSYYWEETISYKRHIVEPISLIDAILNQRREIGEFFNIRPTKMLIGAMDYESLMGCPEIKSWISFQSQYGIGQTILDLEVQIIPWMKGILLIKEGGKR